MATKVHDNRFDPQELRRRALERLRQRHGRMADLRVNDVEALIHELEVHQVELEVQNEELRLTQWDLAAAMERYRDLYDRAPVGYLTLDADGKILQANQTAMQFCFRDRNEIEGQRMELIALPDDRDKLYLLLRRAAATKLPQTADIRIGQPSGSPRWAHADISQVASSEETPGGFRLTLTDITARVQAEEELSKSEERFHMLADNISQLVWIADTNGEKVWYNQRWLDYTGMTFKERKRWGWTKFHHPDHVDRVIKGFLRALEYGEPWEDTFPLRSKTGEYRWFLVNAIPIRDAAGNIIQWFATNTDITERQQLLAEEQRLREVAEDQARARDEFLSIVSHELRTPLSAILNYVQLMSEKRFDAEAVAHFCEVIERNAQAQEQLIEDLLDTGRIISGKLRLELAQADLRLLLEETIESVRPAAEGKRIELIAQFDELPQKMLCDAERLRQVVWNLLQNAIKFTPEGGRLALRAERDDQNVRLVVSDTGCGIEAGFLPAIFDRFSQHDMSNTRHHAGLGLGLSLAKQLVEMHGGTIEAASAGTGQGATFTVTLPLNLSQAAS
jgi:PAS domain S-box-containing protein